MVKPLVLFTGFQSPELQRSCSQTLADHLDSKIFPEYIAAGRTLRSDNPHIVEAELRSHISDLRPDVVVNLGDTCGQNGNIILPNFAIKDCRRHNSTLPISAIMRQTTHALRADDMPPSTELHNHTMALTLLECRRLNIATAGLVELPGTAETLWDMVRTIGQLSVAFYRP